MRFGSVEATIFAHQSRPGLLVQQLLFSNTNTGSWQGQLSETMGGTSPDVAFAAVPTPAGYAAMTGLIRVPETPSSAAISVAVAYNTVPSAITVPANSTASLYAFVAVSCSLNNTAGMAAGGFALLRLWATVLLPFTARARPARDGARHRAAGSGRRGQPIPGTRSRVAGPAVAGTR